MVHGDSISLMVVRQATIRPTHLVYVQFELFSYLIIYQFNDSG